MGDTKENRRKKKQNHSRELVRVHTHTHTHSHTQRHSHTHVFLLLPAEIQILELLFSVLSKEMCLQRGVHTLGLLHWPLCAFQKRSLVITAVITVVSVVITVL